MECHGVSWCQVSMHFLVNDIFMCFFFGLAIKEVTEALLSTAAESSPKKLRKISCLRRSLWGVTSRWFLEPYPKGNQSIDGDTGRRCWTCSSLCSILRLTTLERAGDGRWRSDGVMEWVFWFSYCFAACFRSWSIDTFLTLRLSDYQYVISEIWYVLVWVAEVIFVVIFYEATLFNGILCEVDAGGLSLRKDRKGDDEDEVN